MEGRRGEVGKGAIYSVNHSLDKYQNHNYAPSTVSQRWKAPGGHKLRAHTDPPPISKTQHKTTTKKAQHRSLDHGTVASGINMNAKGFKWERWKGVMARIGGKRLRSPVRKFFRDSEPILRLWGWTSGDMMHGT